MISDEEAIAAKDLLEVAIRNYYATVEPEALVSAWVLITHKVSDEWASEGLSQVGTLPMAGQSFAMTRGLLDVALDSERFNARQQ